MRVLQSIFETYNISPAAQKALEAFYKKQEKDHEASMEILEGVLKDAAAKNKADEAKLEEATTEKDVFVASIYGVNGAPKHLTDDYEGETIQEALTRCGVSPCNDDLCAIDRGDKDGDICDICEDFIESCMSKDYPRNTGYTMDNFAVNDDWLNGPCVSVCRKSGKPTRENPE